MIEEEEPEINEESQEGDDALSGAFLQMTRLEIIRKLREKDRSYISELEGELEVTRATLCYHLDILEDVGLVEQEYVITAPPESRKGRVRSYYHVNESRLQKAINIVSQMIPKRDP